jgi:hypothetical protein
MLIIKRRRALNDRQEKASEGLDKPAEICLPSITAQGKQNKIEELSHCLKGSRHVG